MHRPVEWQGEFAAALLRPDFPVPAGLTDPSGELSAKRFAVYRNNVTVGLMEALKDAFPVTCRIVGDEFFAAMARIYVAQDPPDSPVLLEYGKGFPQFVASFEPARCLPYLSDVCRIERAWLDAYHAPEASPMEFASLAPPQPEPVRAMRASLHPSVRLLRSLYPVFTIWETNTDGNTPHPIELIANPECGLIARPGTTVEVRGLSVAEFVFLEALSARRTIREAAQLARQSDPVFDVTAALAGTIKLGLILGVDTEVSSPLYGRAG